MFDFITGFTKTGNKCGLRLVDFDDMLFPQYDYKFEKTIKKYTWELLQKQAKENLNGDMRYVSPSVIEHWQSIANGIVPFGYSVEVE
jgi:hypothetical protein